MDPPDAPDDNDLRANGGGGLEFEDAPESGTNGTVELQPLVVANNGPPRAMDAPEDMTSEQAKASVLKNAHANKATNGASSSRPALPQVKVEQVASALSNENIVEGLRQVAVVAHRVASRVGEIFARDAASATEGGGLSLQSSPNALPTSKSATAVDTDANTPDDHKRKKMILLLMATLFVALIGAVLSKGTAVEAEMEVEAGETEEAYHVHSHTSDGKSAPGVNIHLINVEGYQPTDLVNVSDYILPGTEDAPALSAAKGRPYYPTLNHFQHRNPTSPYAPTWGYFDFEDPNPKWNGQMRPQPDFHSVPNRDVSNDDFPEDAWQRDQEYMKAFISEAKLLVNRSMEAVYGEYGVGIPSDGSITLSDELMENRRLFFPWTVKENIHQGGGGSWTTQQSMDGMARRFFHHIMTGDTFKLVLGGHSAAAGHGAGFNQSYIIEAGHVLEPVFAHLGVEFRSYNFAQGGMGTFQQSLAGMDLRGKETDMIYWDSRMTERPETLVNFFLRQALIAGHRSPILMGEGAQLAGFHDTAGAAVANQGNGWVPQTVSEEQVKDVPWAAQYLSCARDATANCKGHEYTAGCWVEREDFTPQVPQGAIVGGQASWHPGNRIHKRRGRMIALIVLKALAYALEKWEELGEESGYPIAEEHWHVTEYYNNIREKAPSVGGCWGNNWRIGQKRHLEEIEEDADGDDGRNLEGEDDPLKGFWPARLCNVPLQGRSLWGPRHNPMETNLLTIIKPNPMGDVDPQIKTNSYMWEPCYEPPDRPAPWTVPPHPEPFAPLIGGARHLNVNEHHRQLRKVEGSSPPKLAKEEIVPKEVEEKIDSVGAEGHESSSKTRLLEDDAIVPGYGMHVKWGRSGVCDGSSHHWCDKPCGSGCLMGGAQDNRGMVCFNGLSGWVIFDIKNVKHGFIGARMEPWHGGGEMHLTDSWSEVNNGGKGNYDKDDDERKLHDEYVERKMRESIEDMKQEIEDDIQAEGDPTRRRLGGGQSCGVAGPYTFEWAINDGEGWMLYSWDKGKFCEHFTRLNYNLDVIKFMDDESKTGDFSLAMRMTAPAGKGEVMCVSHMYWA